MTGHNGMTQHVVSIVVEMSCNLRGTGISKIAENPIQETRNKLEGTHRVRTHAVLLFQSNMH